MLSPALRVPASDSDLGAHFADHRTEILLLGYLTAAAMATIVAVLVALRQLVGDGSRILAGTGLAAGLVTVTMTIGGLIPFSVLAYRSGDVASLPELHDLGWFFINLAAGPPTAISIAAYSTALHRSRQRRGWLVVMGVLVAAAHLLVTAAFADGGGFMSPSGTLAHIVPCLYFAWVAAVSFLLIVSGKRARAD